MFKKIDDMKNILVIKGADFHNSSIEKVEFVSDDVVSIAFKQDGTTTLTAGAEYIYYTIDGTIPTINSTLYTGAFKVTDGTEVKALSVDSNGKKSQVFSAKFEGGGTYDDDGYVLKGMVLHLDGSDFDGTQWADRISSIPFVIGGGAPTLSENGVYFNGSSYMYSDTAINVPSNTGTIEVVLKADATTYQTVFFQGSLDTIAYIINPNNISYTIGRTTHKTKLKGDITKLYTHSISDSHNFFDGELLEDGANERWQNAAINAMIIGAAKTLNSSSYYYEGHIYQIRVYNRILTRDEILNNASVDIEKYGISV